MRDIFAQSDLRSVFSSATFRLNFDAAVNVWTHLPVTAVHMVAVAPAHPPVATHLPVVALGLAPVGSLISRLGIQVRWGELSRCD
jgi:hypothetical protein